MGRRAGRVITDNRRVRGGALPCAGELTCSSRRVAVRDGESCLVAELFCVITRTTLRDAETLRRADGKPP